MPHGDITGFILAGGRSRRMGRDKSRLPWGGHTFLTHAIRRMQQVCERVFVVGENMEAAMPVLNDAFPGCGPLAGLHSALLHTATEWNLVLAVDMPLVPPALLKFLAAQCDQRSLAVVPQVAAVGELGEARGAMGYPHKLPPILQPLCASYHRQLLPIVERALSNRELSIQRLLEQAGQGMMGEEYSAIRIIDERELAAAGFVPDMLMNVNTPADLDRARALAQQLNVG